MMAQILLFRGDDELTRLTLDESEVRIGRTDANQIVISSPKVSREHARIYSLDGEFIIEDFGSSNGCFLGDRRILQHPFKDGDIITIADHSLVFVETDGIRAEVVNVDECQERSPLTGTGPDDGWESSPEPAPGVPSASSEDTSSLQALSEISKALEEARDFKTVLVQIMDKAIAIMGAERGFLMLADPDTGDLRVHVARDCQGDIQGVEREAVSRSLMNKVVETRDPVILDDAQSEEWGTRSMLTHSIHAAICAPLMSRDVVSGVIYVDHRSRKHAFKKKDLAFFTTFAGQAKAAIDSSRVYWELVDSLFRASGDIILICSPDGRITQANRAARDFIGKTSEEIAACKLEDVVVPDDLDKAGALLDETLMRGVVSGQELQITGIDGRRLSIDISSFALRDRLGNAIGLCLIGRDLSEIKGLIDKLETANDRLEMHNSFIRKMFGRYMSDEVVSKLLDSPDHIGMGGDKREVTLLMSDLRGFTSLAERLPPEQVVSILNNYLGTMVDIIYKHQGTINEFIGDAILVIFGAPIQRGDDALRAAACAVEMQLAMESVNEWNQKRGFSELEMGIAINT
ncbi:FHA domain-containing protein, partial [Acidobacteriota bacterium]